MEKFKPYPISFTPILKDRIWGGTKLKTALSKNIPSETTGESWEISTVAGDVSVVENGIYKGKNLNELINISPEAVLGKKIHEKFGIEFPLLFKFLDAKQDLSVQVHPNDALAKKRHNTFGKTEMWFVMQADEDAKLIIGFKKKTSKEDFLKKVKDNTVIELLDEIKPIVGDVYYLATGTVHAIGAGTVIAEIQQTSDITYRIYDFDRIGDDGKKRELHLDLAMDAIEFESFDTKKTYHKIENTINNIVDSPYFVTAMIPLAGKMEIDQNTDSFSVLMCVEGNFSILHSRDTYNYKKGQTVLVPAQLGKFSLTGNAKLLEIHI